jgi:hypothetical protein
MSRIVLSRRCWAKAVSLSKVIDLRLAGLGLFDPHSRPNQLPELPSPLNPRPTQTYRKPSAFIVLIG